MFCDKTVPVNVVIVVLTFLRTGICSTDPCIGPSLLGDTRRTTTEDPGTCGGLCDNNINEGQLQVNCINHFLELRHSQSTYT